MGRQTKDGVTTTQHLICGGIAGAASRTFTSPLDVLKILFQLQVDPIAAGSQGHYRGLGHAFTTIVKEEGVRGLWKGNVVACVRLAPYTAVKFAAYEQMKKLWSNKETGRLSNTASTVAGGLSGIAAVLATYPLDVVKTRLTLQRPAADGSLLYKGTWDCLVKMRREEGIRSWYKGLVPTIGGVFPYEGAQFAFYESIRRGWESWRGKENMNAWDTLAIGSLAGAIAQTFSYPFDLIRKRMQAESNAAGMLKPRYNGAWDCCKQIVKSEGFFGLYKGTVPNLLKVAPYAAIMFAAYEESKLACISYNKYQAGKNQSH